MIIIILSQNFASVGVCITETNRIFVAGGNYVYHEYKMFKKLAKETLERADHLRDGNFSN